MDTGTWTLRCYRCNKTFEVELKPTERVIQYAQKTPCPHCNMKPAEAKGSPSLASYHCFSCGNPAFRPWSTGDSNRTLSALRGLRACKAFAMSDIERLQKAIKD